jgi:hypothetical protein
MFIKRNLKSNQILHGTYNQRINIWILVDYLIPPISHIVMLILHKHVLAAMSHSV